MGRSRRGGRVRRPSSRIPAYVPTVSSGMIPWGWDPHSSRLLAAPERGNTWTSGEGETQAAAVRFLEAARNGRSAALIDVSGEVVAIVVPRLDSYLGRTTHFSPGKGQVPIRWNPFAPRRGASPSDIGAALAPAAGRDEAAAAEALFAALAYLAESSSPGTEPSLTGIVPLLTPGDLRAGALERLPPWLRNPGGFPFPEEKDAPGLAAAVAAMRKSPLGAVLGPGSPEFSVRESLENSGLLVADLSGAPGGGLLGALLAAEAAESAGSAESPLHIFLCSAGDYPYAAAEIMRRGSEGRMIHVVGGEPSLPDWELRAVSDNAAHLMVSPRNRHSAALAAPEFSLPRESLTALGEGNFVSVIRKGDDPSAPFLTEAPRALRDLGVQVPLLTPEGRAERLRMRPGRSPLPRARPLVPGGATPGPPPEEGPRPSPFLDWGPPPP